MLERQVEERPQICRDALVVAIGDGKPRMVAGQRIGREHVRSAAKAVARKLVEQDHQRQCAIGRAIPVVELSPRCAPMQVRMALAELRVETVVLAEPRLLASRTPEPSDLGDRGKVGRIDLNGHFVCSAISRANASSVSLFSALPACLGTVSGVGTGALPCSNVLPA